MAKQQPENALQRIAQDLLTIEVNTIVKHGMTARKMPPIPIALIEIIRKYYWFLVEILEHKDIKANINERVANGTAKIASQTTDTNAQGRGFQSELSAENRTNGIEHIKKLRLMSEDLIILYYELVEDATARQIDVKTHTAGEGISSVEYTLLNRIYRTSSILEEILKRLKEDNKDKDVWDKSFGELIKEYDNMDNLNIHANDAAFIRKAWEIGTEVVVMQSVIQLDGDIITSIQDGFDTIDKKNIQDLHLANCKLGIETWQVMTQTVGSFLEGVGKLFLAIIFPSRNTQ